MAHVIEIAKSGRAGCRGCNEKIAKDEVRFGEEVPNIFAQEAGNTYRWWHLPCAAKKVPNDLRTALRETTVPVPDRDAIEALIEEHAHPDYPYAELAPNGRAKCRVCQVTIPKNGARVVFERNVETSMGLTRGPGYMHAACAMAYPDAQALGKDALAAALREHSKLAEADLEAAIESLGSLDIGPTPAS